MGSIAGGFSSIVLPNLPGLAWDTSQLDAGSLRVVIPGDFNQDGAVDAADYIVWRKGIPPSNTPTDYNLWHTRFGESLTGGSGASSGVVPEPTSLALLLFATPFALLRRPKCDPAPYGTCTSNFT